MFAQGGFLAEGIVTRCVENWVYVNDFGELIDVQGCASLSSLAPFPFHSPLGSDFDFRNLLLPSRMSLTSEEPDISSWCPLNVHEIESEDEIFIYSPFPGATIDSNHKQWGFCTDKENAVRSTAALFESVASKLYQPASKDSDAEINTQNLLTMITGTLCFTLIVAVAIVLVKKKRKKSRSSKETSNSKKFKPNDQMKKVRFQLSYATNREMSSFDNDETMSLESNDLREAVVCNNLI